MSNEKLEINDNFVENLTHRAYFIQTKRIKPSFNTRLEKLLSIFEQGNFIDDSETTKLFSFESDDSEVNEVLSVLQYVAADKKARIELDKEIYYQKSMEWAFGEQNKKMEKYKKEIEEKNKKIEELSKEKIEMAQGMKQIGIPISQIAQITGLSVERIEEL